MDKRVGLIGCGWVGTSVALSSLQSGAADPLWLHDLRGALAEGEALDLAHGARRGVYPRCPVLVARMEQMREAQVVVVAERSGRARWQAG